MGDRSGRRANKASHQKEHALIETGMCRARAINVMNRIIARWDFPIRVQKECCERRRGGGEAGGREGSRS